MSSHNPIIIDGGVTVTGPGGLTSSISVTTNDAGNPLLVFDGPVSSSGFTGAPCYLTYAHKGSIDGEEFPHTAPLLIGTVSPSAISDDSWGHIMPKNGKVTDITVSYLGGEVGDSSPTASFDIYKNGVQSSASLMTVPASATPVSASAGVASGDFSAVNYNAGDGIELKCILNTPEVEPGLIGVQYVIAMIRIEET